MKNQLLLLFLLCWLAALFALLANLAWERRQLHLTLKR